MKRKIAALGLTCIMLLFMLPVHMFGAQEQMSDAFKAMLNEKGQLELDCIAPPSQEEAWFYLGEYMWMSKHEEYGEVFGDSETWNPKNSTCDVTLYVDGKDETHNVEIVFNYDKDVQPMIEDVVKNLSSADEKYYHVRDLELLNYWLNRKEDDREDGSYGLDNYSGELKAVFNNSNFEFFVDNRAGEDDMLYTSRMGIGVLLQDGVAYYHNDCIGTKAEHVFYVSDETGDTKEELMQAVQDRIDAYAGEGKVKVEYGGKGILAHYLAGYDAELEELNKRLAEAQVVVDDYVTKIDACNERIAQVNGQIGTYDQQIDECNNEIARYEELIITDPDNAEEYTAQIQALQQQASDYDVERNNLYSEISALEEEKNTYEMEKNSFEFMEMESIKSQIESVESYKQFFLESYNSEDGSKAFIKQAEGDYWFKTTVNEVERCFIVVKDSDKVITPEYVSSDVKTDVAVSSKDSSIPLDTMVSVDKITEGKEYDKITGVLGITDGETFDIKLYSNTLGTFFKKLNTGEFEVKIPVPNRFVDKELMVYYVDDNEKVVEHKVTVKDGYAIFTTDHFSVYTLAEKKDAKKPIYEDITDPSEGVNAQLTQEIKDIMNRIPFTKEEQEWLDKGANFRVKLDVKEMDHKKDIPVAEKAIFDNFFEKNEASYTLGQYFDINLFKQIGDNDPSKVHQLKDSLQISIKIPEELLAVDEGVVREYTIITLEDDEVEVIKPEFNEEYKTLTFMTYHFSTYAIAYSDEKAPQTGDTTPYWGLMACMLVGTAFVTFGLRRRKAQ